LLNYVPFYFTNKNVEFLNNEKFQKEKYVNISVLQSNVVVKEISILKFYSESFNYDSKSERKKKLTKIVSPKGEFI
jgi:hypothetical protein